jgi:hypothetical protein
MKEKLTIGELYEKLNLVLTAAARAESTAMCIMWIGHAHTLAHRIAFKLGALTEKADELYTVKGE